MRFLACLVVFSALSQSAIAQTPNCKSIPDPGARLACYDKASPAAASAEKPAAPGKPPVSKVEAGKYVDSIGAEDELVNARLKNICRGC